MDIINASATFTRPADTTAYASGDLVANSTTAGSVTPMSFTVTGIRNGGFILRRVKLAKSGTSTTNALFRIHFYAASPTIANGDNGAYSTSGVADYLGAFDITVDRAFTDGACGIGTPVSGFDMVRKVSGGQIIYALTEARGAYTPASSEVFTVTLEDLQTI